jgi:hypothetical protein
MIITGAIRLCLICVPQNFGWGQALQQCRCLWLQTRMMAGTDNISTVLNICHACYQSTPLTLAIRHDPGSVTFTSHPHITFPEDSSPCSVQCKPEKLSVLGKFSADLLDCDSEKAGKHGSKWPSVLSVSMQTHVLKRLVLTNDTELWKNR